MRWEDQVAELLEDLEQQAEGLHLTERDLEVADRGRAEYAQVRFGDRLHASVQATVRFTVTGAGHVEGTLSRVGADWCLLHADDTGAEWIVRTAAIRFARGLSDRAIVEPARPALARLGLGSVLRGVADARETVVVHHLDGAHTRGGVARVGADFLELLPEVTEQPSPQGQIAPHLLPFAGIAAVRRP
jgi:hypothetical protein